VQGIIAGKWQIQSLATDLNHNNIADSNEIWSPSRYKFTDVIYNTNGTGFDTSAANASLITSFSWTLMQNDTLMALINSGTTVAYYQVILKINATTMIIKDTSGQNNFGGPFIETWVKQ
jgi:hypothetical protein